MSQVFALLQRAAASNATVLLEGETGTGKEAAAKSIHSRSARRGKPFIVVDCGALPPSLIEGELFGHRRGAFTGAAVAREGLLAAASGGTLFLDEIGELPLKLQPKLLGALERRQIKPVGDSKYVPIDVRVIAATNRDLRAELRAGRFRSDLYYRLAVLQIHLPPLRQRREDLLPLVERFLRELGASDAERKPMRGEEFKAQLARHSWPGNARELRNYVERCLALNAPAPIVITRPEEKAWADITCQPLRAARVVFEKHYLQELLDRHSHNVTAASCAAGVGRANLYRLLWRHKLR
jgi:transcriptional regulator with PAS, ATPase and Fis domain